MKACKEKGSRGKGIASFRINCRCPAQSRTRPHYKSLPPTTNRRIISLRFGRLIAGLATADALVCASLRPQVAAFAYPAPDRTGFKTNLFFGNFHFFLSYPSFLVTLSIIRYNLSLMNRATFIGTVYLKFLDQSANNWIAGTMEDIIAEDIIVKPHDYFFTLGSGIYSGGTSLATIPAYRLPTNSQFYLAGRDVFRWGGIKDPYEVDFDRYGFTPDYAKGVAVVWKAPKSEPHHLSKLPKLFDHIPNDWREICTSIITKQFP